MSDAAQSDQPCVRCGHARKLHGAHPRYTGTNVCGAVVESRDDGVMTPDYCGCVGFITEWPERKPGDPPEPDFFFSFPAQGLIKSDSEAPVAEPATWEQSDAVWLRAFALEVSQTRDDAGHTGAYRADRLRRIATRLEAAAAAAFPDPHPDHAAPVCADCGRPPVVALSGRCRPCGELLIVSEHERDAIDHGGQMTERAHIAEAARDAAVREAAGLRAALEHARDWRGLDGDGISDPVRAEILAALDPPTPEVPHAEEAP